MMQGSQVNNAVQEAIGPLLAGEGFELVFVEVAAATRIVRLYIDKEGGITLEDCTTVSRLVGDVLDASGLSDSALFGSGKFTLEVSSPGLDRPLVTPAHFIRFQGRMAVLGLSEPLPATDPGGQPRRKVTGKIVQADAESIQIEADDGTHKLPYSAIGRARLVPQYDI